MTDVFHSKGHWLIEQSKHRRFFDLVELVEKNKNITQIYTQSQLELRTTPSFGRQVIDMTTSNPVWTESIPFGTSVDAYERFAKAYNALAHTKPCSQK